MSRSGRSRSTHKEYREDSRPFTSNTEAPINNMNVYAEVRGKYARPLPQLNQFDLPAKLAPKGNSVIARPATSGSLVRAGSAHKPEKRTRRESDAASEVSRRSVAQEPPRSYRSNRNVPAESKRESARRPPAAVEVVSEAASEAAAPPAECLDQS